MTTKLIDMDAAKLEAVQALLGTTTPEATVNSALAEMLALDQRRRVLLAERGVGLADLSDPNARQSAWGSIPTS